MDEDYDWKQQENNECFYHIYVKLVNDIFASVSLFD